MKAQDGGLLPQGVLGEKVGETAVQTRRNGVVSDPYNPDTHDGRDSLFETKLAPPGEYFQGA